MSALQFLLHSFPFREMTLALVAVTLLVMGLYWYGYHSFSKLKTLNIPGPKPHAFVGNIPEVKKAGGLHAYHLQCLKKYGKVFTFCLGKKVSIVVADPEILKQIMVKEFPNFVNRSAQLNLSRSPFSKNVLAQRDENWKRIRKLLTPSFSSAKLKQMLNLMDEATNILIKKMEEVADTGKSVNMHQWFSQMTLDVIMSTAFGMESDVQKNPDSETMRAAERLLRRPPTVFRLLLALPFGRVFGSLFLLLFSPINYFVDLAAGIVKIRRDEICKGNLGRKDLLRLMLASQDENKIEVEGPGLTDDEVVAQCVVFILAGHQTSSNTLAFVAYHLAMNPEIQEKLRVEIETALQSNAGMPMYDLVQKIEYLDCVIDEAQRLHPPVYVMNRECKKSCTINGVHFPAGIDVNLPFYALHNDPDAWPNVEKFDPERFHGPNKDTIHPFQFMPFGAGPRNCIGMRFALVEMKLTLVKIMTKFRFVRSPETQAPLMLNAGAATLSARDGVHVRLESLN